MTGRTRRASTSSIETVDNGPRHWRQEASVLRSVAKTEPSDNWPIFQLRDAIVLNRDGTTLENALNIVPNGPFIVRGNLYYTSAEKRLVMLRERSPIPIEIRHCLLYSVGETEDGSPQIWISGRAGWFEISPSPAYQATYDIMCQATTLYYSIMDTIEEMHQLPKRGKRPKSPSSAEALATIFHKYSASAGDGSTHEDIVERCHTHAIFLISQFTQDDAPFDWATTGFYKWMKSRYSNIFQKVETARQNPRQRTRSPSFVEPPLRASTNQSRKSASIEEIDEITFNTTRTHRSNSAVTQKTTIPLHPRRAEQTPVKAESGSTLAELPTAEDSPFASVLAALEDCFNALLPSKSGVKVSGLLNKFYFQYRFPTYKDSTSGSHKRPVEEVLHYNAAALLGAIDVEKYQNGEIYDWLQELAGKKFVPVAMKQDAFPYRLVLRVQRPFMARKSDKRPTSIPMRENNLQRTPSPVTPRVGKRPGRPVGSKSSLRPVKSTKKRARNIVEDDESETESVAKKHQFSSHYDGDEAMTDAGDDQISAEEFNGGFPASISLDSSSEDDILDDEEHTHKLTILAEKLPDSMPVGYQGTWVCEQQDCGFIARGGDHDELDDRISAHLQEHEQLVDKMKLAVAESRGHLPINHLLDKLKQVGAGAPGPVDTQGIVAPRPIKRNLFV